mgnify:FL=1
MDPIKLKYIEYKYKINPRTYEWLLNDVSITHMNSDDRYEFMKFDSKIEQTHTLRRDKDGRVDMEGSVYFNDIEELVFDKATQEDKEHLRKRIKEEMVVCDPPVTGWGGVYE